MQALVRDIDLLLRGRFTRSDDLRKGKIRIPTRTLVRAGLVLGAVAGLFVGLYGVLRPGNVSFLQTLATTVKVPLLFLLTLAVTLPSLYVFSALAQSTLRFKETMRLLLAAIAVNLALLASFGPVIAFFTLSTDSYPFMVLLNVLFFAASGFAGLVFLRRALRLVFEGRLEEPGGVGVVEGASAAKKTRDGAGGVPGEAGAEVHGPLEPPRSEIPPPPSFAPRESFERSPRVFGGVSHEDSVFRVWIFIYGVVGAQMGWILRPFIGSPALPFELFRERESSFFGGVLDALEQLMW